MSEFCLDCMNKYMIDNANKLRISDVVTDIDFCEGCGETKPCVIKIKRRAQYKFLGTEKRKWYQFWNR